MKRKILSTKVLDPASTAILTESGWLVDCIPFIITQPVQNPKIQQEVLALSGKTITAIFTSPKAVNAVSHFLGSKSAHWNIACISGKTKIACASYFPECRIIAEADDSQKLANKLSVLHHEVNVIFFAGNLHLDYLQEVLSPVCSLQTVVVYETIPHPCSLSANDYAAVFFFSPSGVKSFFQKNILRTEQVCVAIGMTTESVLREYQPNAVIITAEIPTQTAMISAWEQFYKKNNKECN